MASRILAGEDAHRVVSLFGSFLRHDNAMHRSAMHAHRVLDAGMQLATDDRRTRKSVICSRSRALRSTS